jgi:hypothetical protein
MITIAEFAFSLIREMSKNKLLSNLLFVFNNITRKAFLCDQLNNKSDINLARNCRICCVMTREMCTNNI